MNRRRLPALRQLKSKAPYNNPFMTTGNHILVGTLIAVTVKQPVLVLPLAFASHFVLDSLPHYGYEGNGYGVAMKHKTTFVMEALGIAGIILLLTTGLYGLNLVTLASIVAVSPDFEWIYRYFIYERRGLELHDTLFTKFHKKVQWGERKWGIYVEVPFFAVGYCILLSKI